MVTKKNIFKNKNIKVHIKKGNNVIVLSGKDKGKKGKVLSVDKVKQMAIVEGISIATKHKKPRTAGEVGGIVKEEIPIRICKLMNVCPKCDKPSKVGRKILENGNHVRFCKKCGENFE